MNSDNRLYTIWNYDEVVTYANRFVEFRIIQVGAHDNDSSNVTFMATHSLPTAQLMNQGTATDPQGTNAGGWEKSYMRTTVFGDEGYVQTGLSGLKDAAVTISKKATSGSSGNWTEGSTTQDKFWLLSFSELAGENTTPITSNGYYKNEGSQYTWCKNNVTAPASKNANLTGIEKCVMATSIPLLKELIVRIGGCARRMCMKLTLTSLVLRIQAAN